MKVTVLTTPRIAAVGTSNMGTIVQNSMGYLFLLSFGVGHRIW